MKVIIFGGTGWVGHNIAVDFNKAGHQVVICSRGKKNDYIAAIPKDVITIAADKQNEQEVAKIFEDRYDIVIDTVPTEASISNVVKFSRNTKHYLHCSSVMSYAPLTFIPGDETMPFSDYMGLGKKKNIVVFDTAC